MQCVVRGWNAGISGEDNIHQEVLLPLLYYDSFS
jgi:hypothetical protein